MDHKSVLLTELIELLEVKPHGVYVDLTLGRGGHSKLLLENLNSDGTLIVFDKDIVAINEVKVAKTLNQDNVIFIHQDFRHLKMTLEELGYQEVDGIIADLGMSSPQVDDPSRGFSYQEDGPLDMRMNQNDRVTAREIVNTYSYQQLVRVFYEYGDEKYAPQIAKRLILARDIHPITTTFELVTIVKNALPMKELAKKGHPAKKVFQALRIEVNDELNALREMLSDATKLLKRNGRLLVITFQEDEDRIVKQFFNSLAKVKQNRYDPHTIVPEFKLLLRHALTPSEAEVSQNHRSKSAHLRGIIKK
ncbi:MAG: 16S rRNA (cytosine(1402)-N(4))-methyltransferase RsmH [Erysipelotrichaceae bacterium]|jgi:16S rRNA (cytosine1402-N4)-methyltransferase|nr:16S rRNA (cytosine(1402)-N(4))-methyltransferase RsmH [Erysipelotrichaceae bacterium]